MRSPCSTGRPRCRRLAAPGPCPSRRACRWRRARPMTVSSAPVRRRHASGRCWLVATPTCSANGWPRSGPQTSPCRPSTSRSSSSGPEMTPIASGWSPPPPAPSSPGCPRSSRLSDGRRRRGSPRRRRGSAAPQRSGWLPCGPCGRPTRLRSTRDCPVVCPGSGWTFEPPATPPWPSASRRRTRASWSRRWTTGAPPSARWPPRCSPPCRRRLGPAAWRSGPGAWSAPSAAPVRTSSRSPWWPRFRPHGSGMASTRRRRRGPLWSAPARAGGRRHAAGGLGGHVRRCASVGAGE